MNRQITLTLVITMIISTATPVALGRTMMAPIVPTVSSQNHSDIAKQIAFRNEMRKLWEDHVTWTRLFIVSAAANLSDNKSTTDRLLQNQVDIGNAIKPFYGDAAGNQLTTLLKEHITTAAELVTAAKANDKAKMVQIRQRWFANADAITDFLSHANPKSWPDKAMRQMMYDHLNLTADEVQARLNKNWTADIADYDRVHVQILHMADQLSMGIIEQFPKKFE